MADFDAKTDTPATSMDAADKIPFGDVSADAWDTITAAKQLKALADVTDNASGVRTSLGLGTAATQATSDFDAAGSAAAAQAASQPVDADLTAIAALTPSNDDVLQRKSGAWANRTIAQLLTDLGLAALYQPLDSDLTAIAALTTTSFGRALLALADAAALRTAGDVYSTSQVDAAIATAVTGLLDFKGATNCSSNPNYPSASKGDSYVVSVAGKIGGASGTSVDVGDVFFATADNAGGTQASVGSSWTILEHNLTGALLAANNLSDLASASTARANLGLGTVATLDSDTDGTLAANSDSKVATQKAVKTYVTASALTNPVVGTLTVQQSGGTPGTDEVQISHDGSQCTIAPKEGGLTVSTLINQIMKIMRSDETGRYLTLDADSAGFGQYISSTQNLTIQAGVGSAVLKLRGSKFVFVDASFHHWWAIETPAQAVFRFTDGDVGGAQLELPLVSDVGTPSTDCARLGAEDVSGTAELIASDEAGNETQITPHAPDGPPELYDETPGAEHVVRTINRFAGTVEFLNLTRLAKAVASGDKATCFHSEKLAGYNARTGRNKTKLDWDVVQQEKQAAYNAARAAELVKFAEWQALPANSRPSEAPVVRPQVSIVKPQPAWISTKLDVEPIVDGFEKPA